MRTVRWKPCITLMAVGLVAFAPSPRPGLAADVGSAGAPPTVPPSERPDPTGVLTLRQALAAALVGNPELAEFSWELRADDARVLQAGRRPNPQAALVAEDVVGTGRYSDGSQSQTTLELSQLLELGGKRRARVDVAERSRDLTYADYELKRTEVAAEIARRFVRVLGAERGADLARSDTALARATAASVSQRVKAGAGSALEDRKAQIAVARARIATEHAEHILAVERRELAALWGGSEARFDRAEGDLFARRTLPTFAVLAARLSEGPAAARSIREARLRAAEVRLAAAQRVPGLTIGTGVRRLEGPDDESFLFSFGLPLPILDRNQGAIAVASALAGKADAKGRSTDLRLRTVLFGLHQELTHAAIELDALEHEILPWAEESLALARRGFDEGRFSYLELLDSQRTLTELRRERIDAALAYRQLVIEIERLIGGSMDAPTPDANREEGLR